MKALDCIIWGTDAAAQDYNLCVRQFCFLILNQTPDWILVYTKLVGLNISCLQ